MRGSVRLIGVVLGTSSNTERDQQMTTLLDDGFNQVNGSSNRFGGLFGVANAAATFSVRSSPPPLEPMRSVLAPPVARDRGVQAGAYPAERIAGNVAQALASQAPGGTPRVQPILYGRRTVYLAQVLGLSEAEAQTVCGNLSRRVPRCQVLRAGTGQTVLR
jgi:D-alanyl-D-alanine carboxypeptidase